MLWGVRLEKVGTENVVQVMGAVILMTPYDQGDEPINHIFCLALAMSMVHGALGRILTLLLSSLLPISLSPRTTLEVLILFHWLMVVGCLQCKQNGWFCDCLPTWRSISFDVHHVLWPAVPVPVKLDRKTYETPCSSISCTSTVHRCTM